jgi:hypothetical protein
LKIDLSSFLFISIGPLDLEAAVIIIAFMTTEKITPAKEERTASPRVYASLYKEDAEDRLVTRNSLQMTVEECLEGRRSKGRKIKLVQRSQRHKDGKLSTPTLEEVD